MSNKPKIRIDYSHRSGHGNETVTGQGRFDDATEALLWLDKTISIFGAVQITRIQK